MIRAVFVPDGFVRRIEKGSVAILRNELSGVDDEVLWRRAEALGVDTGRGSIWRTRLGDLELVMRDYRRGGLLRALLPDVFASPRRACRELEVSVLLARAGVPTIEVMGAVARRRGPGWQLRLVTRRLDGATDLVAFAAEHPRHRHAAVRAAGAVVAAAFAAGLAHPDLHPANLLARLVDDAVQVVLIDLDRTRLVPRIDAPLRDAMLVRMARWLRRHAQDLPLRPTRSDHLRFLAGMGMDRAARHVLWPTLDRRLQAALQRRGLAAR